MKGNIKVILGVLVILIMLDGAQSGFNLLSLTSQSYVSGYQGARARFAGVQYKDDLYGGGATQIPQLLDTTFIYDPDTRGSGEVGIADFVVPPAQAAVAGVAGDLDP